MSQVIEPAGSQTPAAGRAAPADAARDALARCPVFVDLTEADTAAIAAYVELRPLAAGQVLVAAGAHGDELFVIADGAVEVTTADAGGRQHVTTLAAGSLVAETATLTGGPVTATVTAVTPARVVVLGRRGVDIVAERRADVAARLANRVGQRARRMRLASYLDALFAGAVDGLAAELAAVVVYRPLAAGEVLFEQGAAPDDAYIVVSGRLRAEAAVADGEPVVVCDIGPGGLVGEAALVTDRPRAATVRAGRDAEVAVVTRDHLQRLLDDRPAAALTVLRNVAERATGSRADVSARGRGPATVAVVAASPSASAVTFATELTAALTSHGRTAHLTSATVDARLAAAGIAQSSALEAGSLRLAEWLASVEQQHDFVVLQADADDTAWSRRCARHAERVLLVADATDTAEPGDLAAALGDVLRAAGATTSLVLVHPYDTDLPSGTSSWLSRFAVDDHHHVRAGERGDVDRVARSVAGRSVALVLGGGGARGFAHLGAYRALRDEGVPVDLVAGVGIGAAMAAVIALHGDPETARDHARRMLRGLCGRVPPVSRLAARRIWADIQSACAGRDVEDLWVPFLCVSTDLTRARPLVHRRGSLAWAVRASIALPGLLPPVVVDGSVVVDGTVLDHLPVEETRRTQPDGTVIAVDVAPRRGSSAHEELPPAVSGWRLLGRRLLRHGHTPRTLRLVAAVLRATVVASARSPDDGLERGLADCHLDLELRGCDLLDLDGFDAVADRGYAEAASRLRDWLATETGARVPRSRPSLPGRSAPRTGRRSALAEERGMWLLTVRDLRHRANRFAVATIGTALVFALLLVLTGLVTQFRREPRLTVAAFGADGWVLREGVPGPFNSAATIDAAASRDLREARRADPVVVARHSLDVGGEPRDIVVVGHVPGGLGTPALKDGTAASRPTQVVVSDGSGMEPGSTAVIGGRRYRVTGTTRDMTVFAGMPIVLMGLEDAQELLYDGQPLASAILVAGRVPQVPEGLQVLTGEAVAEDALRPLERPIDTVNLIRVLLWVVAAGIIGAVAYLGALDRQRDVAVLKAIGASSRSLVVSIATQAVFVAVAASLLAAVLQVGIRPLFPMNVHLTIADLLRLPVIAGGVALAAATGGIRRTLRADPAAAFAGPGG